VDQQPSSQRKVCDMTECMYPKTSTDVVADRTSQSTHSINSYLALCETKIEKFQEKGVGDFEKKSYRY